MPRNEYVHDFARDNEEYNAREREHARQLADERDEKIAAFEMSFEETPHCQPECSAPGSFEHAGVCRIANELERIGGVLEQINTLLTPRIPPGVALIGNGLFVRTGTGRKK